MTHTEAPRTVMHGASMSKELINGAGLAQSLQLVPVYLAVG